MKKSGKNLRMLSGALLFACGLAGLVWRATTEHAEVSLVWALIFMSVGVALFASAQGPTKKEQ